jgi:anhydro-N-acetylmuramic acid kinase
VIVAGVMSGTSLDGIDVAIVEIGGVGWKTRVHPIASQSTPYPRKVRQAILGVSNRETHTREIARLHFLLAELYSEAVNELAKSTGVRPALIGCHGQTIYHEGAPARYLGRRVASTLQIGDGSVIAERTGVPVISDFRPRDMAAGGRGAPLVPFVDYLLFRDRRKARVAVNIGGIANLTAIPAAAAPEQVIAFDTGPGNMVIDALAAIRTHGRRTFDKEGRLAERGRVSTELLARLTSDPYYTAPPPKTAGREQYGREFVDRLMASGLAADDLIATATALTAATIAEGIMRFADPRAEVIVSGGGAHNPVILRHLVSLLPHAAVATSGQHGIDVDAKEAIAFAVLAHESWRRRPANLPSATGARRAVVLGKLSP